MSSLSTIPGIRKLETLGYPMVETASLCIPSFWHNTGVRLTDGQTDGRICRSISIYCACKASFATCCNKIIRCKPSRFNYNTQTTVWPVWIKNKAYYRITVSQNLDRHSSELLVNDCSRGILLTNQLKQPYNILAAVSY